MFLNLGATVNKNMDVYGLLAENSSGNMVKTDTNKIVVLDSLDDFIVVEEKEILLIFPKTKEQDIKQLRERVKEKFGDQHI